MNRITEITKRDILDLFQNGLEIDEFFQTRTVTYNYYGRLEEIDFLKRLYDLERMPSFDSRFANAEQDIWQHSGQRHRQNPQAHQQTAYPTPCRLCGGARGNRL